MREANLNGTGALKHGIHLIAIAHRETVLRTSAEKKEVARHSAGYVYLLSPARVLPVRIKLPGVPSKAECALRAPAHGAIALGFWRIAPLNMCVFRALEQVQTTVPDLPSLR